MSELKWVCSAKGGWAPLPPLSHKEIMQPYSGEGTPTISKLSSWEEEKKRFTEFLFIPAKPSSALLRATEMFK